MTLGSMKEENLRIPGVATVTEILERILGIISFKTSVTISMTENLGQITEVEGIVDHIMVLKTTIGTRTNMGHPETETVLATETSITTDQE